MKMLLLWLVFLNGLAFVLMGLDKWKARYNRWRIPEKTLFLSAILGGSLGSLFGMVVFHHKTKHKVFQIGMPVIFLIQCVLVAGLNHLF